MGSLERRPSEAPEVVETTFWTCLRMRVFKNTCGRFMGAYILSIVEVLL